jgi:hypothetical protein
VQSLECLAGDKHPNLTNGQHYQEVIKLWGAPLEREERESARSDVWHYPFGKVRFHEGRVVKWSLNNKPAVPTEVQDSFRQPEAAARKSSATDVDEDPLLVEEILEEIMKEAPQGEDKAPPGNLPPPPPPPPGMIMPNQPPVTTP